MAEYINRKSVYETACEGCILHGIPFGSCYAEEPCGRLFEAFVSAPTADVVEVVHGRWVDRYNGKYANPLYECSECKGTARYQQNYDVLDNGLWLQDLSDYCPNCGAKMDGGTDHA